MYSNLYVNMYVYIYVYVYLHHKPYIHTIIQSTPFHPLELTSHKSNICTHANTHTPSHTLSHAQCAGGSRMGRFRRYVSCALQSVCCGQCVAARCSVRDEVACVDSEGTFFVCCRQCVAVCCIVRNEAKWVDSKGTVHNVGKETCICAKRPIYAYEKRPEGSRMEQGKSYDVQPAQRD